MSLTMSSGGTASMGEVKAASSKTAKAASLVDMTAALAAAKVGTLTVRTNTTDGSLTMAPGHGIVTGAKATIFWLGGIRYNVTIGTVAGDVVPFVGATGGGGDILPAVSAAVTVMVQNPAPATIQHPMMKGMMIGGIVPFAVIFTMGANMTAAVFSRDAAGDNYIYDASTGYPWIAGQQIDNIAIVHSDATKGQTITCKILSD